MSLDLINNTDIKVQTNIDINKIAMNFKKIPKNNYGNKLILTMATTTTATAALPMLSVQLLLLLVLC